MVTLKDHCSELRLYIDKIVVVAESTEFIFVTILFRNGSSFPDIKATIDFGTNDLIGALDRLTKLPNNSVEYIDAMDPGLFIYSIPEYYSFDDSMRFRLIMAIDAEFISSGMVACCGPAIAIKVRQEDINVFVLEIKEQIKNFPRIQYIDGK